jgi:hypothetical protein
MGYILKNRIEVSVLFNGAEYPLDNMNQLQFMHLGMLTRTSLPTCHFCVQDVTHYFDVVNLQDGLPITISVRPLGSDTQTFNFRKFNHKKRFNGVNFEYEIDGYLDVPLYWAQTSIAGIQGTSNDALSQIAATVGLQYDGISTSDSQLWLPRNRTYAEFVKDVVSHGYASPASYMVSGIDLSGTLLYRDVMNLQPAQGSIVLGQVQDGSFIATDYKPLTSSGLTNKMQGYQHTRYNQSMVSQTPNTAYTELQLTPDVTSPLYNQQVANAITSGYKSFGGIDVGNVHDQYELAYYQNQRYAAMFSLAVEFQLMTPTNYTLFDKFTFSVDTDDQKADVPYAGEYTVAGKAWYVEGPFFAEKLLGVRMGVNGQ